MDRKNKKKLLIIANAGPGKKKGLNKILPELGNILNIHNCDYEIFFTQKEVNGSALLKNNLDESYTDIVAIGGDGTINEVINGFDCGEKVFSFIPNGSANDFAKNFDLKTLEKQIRNIVEGKVYRIDLGQCNERKFINGVGIGFDGQVIYEIQNQENHFGAWNYYFHVLKNLAVYKSQMFQYSLDKQGYSKKLMLLCIGNGTTFGGGFKLTPLADLFDGYLDACVVGELSGLRRFANIPKLAQGIHDELYEIEFHQVREISIEKNDLLHAHIDGEYMGKPPFEIKILPRHLLIRLPEILRINGFMKR